MGYTFHLVLENRLTARLLAASLLVGGLHAGCTLLTGAPPPPLVTAAGILLPLALVVAPRRAAPRAEQPTEAAVRERLERWLLDPVTGRPHPDRPTGPADPPEA